MHLSSYSLFCSLGVKEGGSCSFLVFAAGMLGRTLSALQKGERGLYFPINHRIVDRRIASGVTVEESDVQSRYRRELRTSFTTGETRQAIPPEWSRRERPTHFLSLRLPVRNVLSTRVKEMHNHILFSHQHCAPLLIPLTKLHITLGVMTIAEDGRDQTLKEVHDCVSEVFSVICPLQLRFRGLGTFDFGRVLFIRAVPEVGFSTLDDAVCQVRQKVGGGLGVDMKGNPHDSYVPHITVAKIRSGQRAQFGTKIPISLWAEYQHHDFGDVTFSVVDICRMQGSTNEYYHTESSVNLSSSSAADISDSLGVLGDETQNMQTQGARRRNKILREEERR